MPRSPDAQTPFKKICLYLRGFAVITGCGLGLPLFALFQPERFRVAFRVDYRIIHIRARFIGVRSNRVRIRILWIWIAGWQGRKLRLRHRFSPPIRLHGKAHPGR